jgi:hypothetical protein
LNWDQINRSYDAFLGDAVRAISSFRDVDETIDFIADGPASVFVDEFDHDSLLIDNRSNYARDAKSQEPSSIPVHP